MLNAQAVRSTATSELKRAGIIDIPNQRQLHLLDVETLQGLAAGED